MKFYITLVMLVCIITIFLLVGVKLFIRKSNLTPGGGVIAHELNVNGDKVVYALCTKPIVIKITSTRGKVLNEFRLQQDCIDGSTSFPPPYDELISGDLFVSKDNIFYLYLRFRAKSHLVAFNETAILDQITDIVDSSSIWMDDKDEALISDFSNVKIQEIRPILELPIYAPNTYLHTETQYIIQYQQKYYAYEDNTRIRLQSQPVFPKLNLYQGEGTLLMAETPWHNEVAYVRPKGTNFAIKGRCPAKSFIKSARCSNAFFQEYSIDGVTFTHWPISPHSKRYVASNNDIIVMTYTWSGRNLTLLKPKLWFTE